MGPHRMGDRTGSGNAEVSMSDQANMRRQVLAFGFSAALGAASVAASLAFAPAAAADCPYGTVPTSFSGVCVQGQAGGFGAPGMIVPPQASAPGAVVSGSPGGLGSVDGIPCTPQRIGTCIGLQQSQG